MAELSTALKRADRVRRDVLSLGRELLAKGRAFEIPEPGDVLTKALEHLDENTYQVLVVGEVKRGKSTLVNALIGRSILPTDVDVATSQAFRVCPSAVERYRLRFEDDSAKEITADELPRYGSQTLAEEDDIPGLGQIIRWIEVDVPARYIPENVRIIDTPGLGSLYVSHGQITRRFIPHGDAVIFVLESQAPISQPELDILKEVLAHTRHIFFVQTKIDQFSKDDWQRIRRRNEAILREKFGDRLPDVRVWPVSSLNLQKAIETGDQDYEVVSRAREMIEAIQEFLFYVAGLGRLNLTVALLQGYYQRGHDLLSDRIRTLEEGQQSLLEARRELEERRDQFERHWGRAGDKRGLLQQTLQEAVATAEHRLEHELDTLEKRLRRQMEDASSVSELKSVVESLQGTIVEELDRTWNDACNWYQEFVLNAVKSFVQDLQVSELRPTSDRLPGKQAPESVTSSDFQALWQALLEAFPSGALGAGVLTLGKIVSLPLLGTILWPVALPVGIVAVGYSIYKMIFGFLKARRNLLQKERERVLEDLSSYFSKSRRQALDRLKEVLRKYNEELLGKIDDQAKRRLNEMSAEIRRLHDSYELAAQERQQKCSELQAQLAGWEEVGRQLTQIDNALREIRETRFSA